MKTNRTDGEWTINPNFKKIVQCNKQKLIIATCSNEHDAKLIAESKNLLEVLKRRLAYENKEDGIMQELAETMSSMGENCDTELAHKLMNDELVLAIKKATE